MKKMLVTGGTVFVSRYIASYYVAKGYQVYVLNRNSRPQPGGTTLLLADRHALGDTLRPYHFDVVVDTGYTAQDVGQLLDALGGYDDYIFVSSSAVYPDTAPQPFLEDTPLGANRFWGRYGLDKAEAEALLRRRAPGAYLLRPPYLYGPMNNVYREAFVFDCALAGRPFYLPRDGEMPLQFFHVQDLCRVIDRLLQDHPARRVFNVGDPESVSVRDWVTLCYRAAGCQPRMVPVYADIEQRSYFCFHDYAYRLDVTAQQALLPTCTPLADGLQEAFAWYRENPDAVNRKPYLENIQTYFA